MFKPSRTLWRASMAAVFIVAGIEVGTRLVGAQGYIYPVPDPEHIPLFILSRYWCSTPQGIDHFTEDTIDYNSQTGANNTHPGCGFEGAVAYVPFFSQDTWGGTTNQLYRLFDAVANNHMDSGATSEYTFALDRQLWARVWAARTAEPGNEGMKVLYGYAGVPAPADDHPLGNENESAQFTAWGYSATRFYGYGYPRPGNACTDLYAVPADFQSTPTASYPNNEMVLRSNKTAGGSIFELWWNGKQFINDYDIAGRQMQISLFKQYSNWPSNYDNPTEAGDLWGWPAYYNSATCGMSHGSPLLNFERTGNVLRTAVHPLVYRPDLVNPMYGGQHHPVMWTGTFAKEVTTRFDNDPQIAKWTTTVTIPWAIAGPTDFAVVSAHLLSEFNRVYLYDVPNTTLSDVTSEAIQLDGNNQVIDGCADFNGNGAPVPVVNGAIIASTSNGSHAIGFYYPNANEPLFGACSLGGSTGQFGRATVSITARLGNWVNIPADYVRTETAYIVVGTLANVQDKMNLLYAHGYKVNP